MFLESTSDVDDLQVVTGEGEIGRGELGTWWNLALRSEVLKAVPRSSAGDTGTGPPEAPLRSFVVRQGAVLSSGEHLGAVGIVHRLRWKHRLCRERVRVSTFSAPVVAE